MFSTMIWMIDEESMYAKNVNCAMNREKFVTMFLEHLQRSANSFVIEKI